MKLAIRFTVALAQDEILCGYCSCAMIIESTHLRLDLLSCAGPSDILCNLLVWLLIVGGPEMMVV